MSITFDKLKEGLLNNSINKNNKYKLKTPTGFEKTLGTPIKIVDDYRFEVGSDRRESLLTKKKATFNIYGKYILKNVYDDKSIILFKNSEDDGTHYYYVSIVAGQSPPSFGYDDFIVNFDLLGNISEKKYQTSKQDLDNASFEEIVSGGKKSRKWSAKYKKSINCKRPKGFSQRQHCKYGRKKTRKNRHYNVRV
jgi:hypothetical protein